MADEQEFEQMFEERVEAYMQANEGMPRLIAAMFATLDLEDETCFVPDLDETDE